MFLPIPWHPVMLTAGPATTPGLEVKHISIDVLYFSTAELSALLNKIFSDS